MNAPIIVIGAGGHAKVVIDALERGQETILGAVDIDPAKHGRSLLSVPVLGGEDVLNGHSAMSVLLVNAIGSIGDTEGRRSVFLRFKDRGYRFHTVVHPAAVVAGDVEIGEGSQIMAGAVVQAGTSIGANCIVNTRSSVDHDCRIGDHVHVAPGSTISGGVTIDERCLVGAGATIIQGLAIGPQCVIGAGAAVISDIGAQTTVLGVPAKQVDR